jgi:hypothetical protein
MITAKSHLCSVTITAKSHLCSVTRTAKSHLCSVTRTEGAHVNHTANETLTSNPSGNSCSKKQQSAVYCSMENQEEESLEENSFKQ